MTLRPDVSVAHRTEHIASSIEHACLRVTMRDGHRTARGGSIAHVGGGTGEIKERTPHRWDSFAWKDGFLSFVSRGTCSRERRDTDSDTPALENR
eukprot:3887967-Rhodomonas_salina.2